MRFSINYTVVCDKGKIRKNNQDNFWCDGKYLQKVNNGLPLPITNSTDNYKMPLFAVFDGMGGESSGETAAYIAAKTLGAAYAESNQKLTAKFLFKTCNQMNAEICFYEKKYCVKRMGTTAAILAFGEDKIYVCNLGDSKIFYYKKGCFKQVTQDHTLRFESHRKPILTQHLGIPETELLLEPFVTKRMYNNGDVYLICSDGLTDMVASDEIEALLLNGKSIYDCSKKLLASALANGGTDNITIILCRISSEEDMNEPIGKFNFNGK